MKWLCALLLFVGTGLGATVIIEEDFEDMFPPAQWDTVPVSGSDYGWVWGDGSSGGDPDNAYSGSKYARFYSYLSSDGYEEDLITDTFDLTSVANCTLSFYYINEYDNTSPPGKDWVKVYYSVDSGKSWVELDSLGIKDAWTHFEYALPDSKIIMIKFRGHSDYGYTNPCIDLFRIKGQIAHNIAVKSLSLSHDAIPPNYTLTITAVIKNKGTSNESNVPVYCWIKNPSDSIVFGDTVTIGELKSDSDTVITWNYGDATEHGDYTVIVKANLSNDAYHNDDKKEESFHCMEIQNMPWSYGFEEIPFPPCGCWKIYNFDGGDQWEQTSDDAHSGNFSVYCRYDIPNNDWLILPPIIAKSNNDTLIFWYRARSSWGTEHFNVRLATGVTTDTSQYSIIWDTSTTATEFQQKKIVLSTLIPGDTFRIAFHYDSDNEYGIYIDDVEFKKGKVYNNDVAVTSVSCKPVAVETSEVETVTARVLNAGYNDQSNFKVKIYVVSPSSDTLFRDSANIGLLTSFSDTTLQWMVTGYTEHGDHIVYVKTCLSGDENPYNDMKSSYFHVKGKIIAPWSEGFEGTTFPPCLCWTDVYGNWKRYEDPSYAHSGAGYAHIDYDVSEGEGILITPTIDAGYFDTLIFWWKEADYKGKDIGHDSTFVEISKDNGTTWIVWKVLKVEHSSTWYAETLIFGENCGPEVKIRWRYQTDRSYSAYGFNLDDIELKAGVRYDHDVGVVKATFLPEICAKKQQDTIKIKVINYGKNDETFDLVKIVKKPSGQIDYCDTTKGIFLKSYKDTFIMFCYTPDTLGKHPVIARVILTDENPADNEIVDTLNVTFPDIYGCCKIGGDGIADVGEDSVELIITLVNDGAYAYCVSCSLSENEENAELIGTAKQTYGDIPYKGEASKKFMFNVLNTASDGEILSFILHIKDTMGYYAQDTVNIMVGGKKWTIMVYIIGDNNLGDVVNGDIDEMESAGSDENINILVQIDGNPSYTYNDLSGARSDANRYYIEKGNSSNDTIDAYPVVSLGEINSADTSNIFSFVKWCIDNYPAKYYAFILWNHGSGWQKAAGVKGAGWDDTEGDMLGISNGELRALLRKIKNYLGRNIDILGFDECLMCMMEIASEAMGYVNYIVASEPGIPIEGWDYTFLQDLKNNPNMTPRELVNKIVKKYGEYYSTSSSVNLNALDIGHSFQKLCWDVDKLAIECLKEGGMNNSQIQNVVSNLQGLIESWSPYDNYVDILRLATDLMGQNISSGINAACDSIISHFGYPPYQEGMPLCTTWCSSDMSGITYGMMINCPDDGSGLSGNWEDPYDYRWLKWAKNSAWYYFIAQYNSLPDTIILSYIGNSFIDEDGDTVPEMGEQVEMDIKIRNSGANTAYATWARLYSEDPQITVLNDSCYFGDIPGDTEVISRNRVKILIGSKCPYGYRATLKLEIHAQSQKSEYISEAFIIFDVGITKGDFPPYAITSAPITRAYMKQNTPNPFAEFTKIEIGIPQKQNFILKIYDITGRCVKTYHYKSASPGIYTIKWNGTDNRGRKLPAGIYFCRLQTKDKIITRKMVKIR